MTRRKISTTVYLDREQADALRARAARTGVPQAAIIRRAIDRELAPAPINALDVVAKLAPEFFKSLSPAETVLVARMWGVT
jgi:hypothetical protein